METHKGEYFQEVRDPSGLDVLRLRQMSTDQDPLDMVTQV